MRSLTTRAAAGRLAAALALTAALAPAAVAQLADPDTLYDYGSVSFSFVQTPFPWYSGSFAAEGPMLNLDGTWPAGVTEVVGGGIGEATPDSSALVVYAMTENANSTVDAAVLMVRTAGTPQPGAHPVDPTTGSAIFGFVDDAAEFALPDTLNEDTVREWLETLPAAHKFVSITGTINVTAVDADQLVGSFSGTCADYDDLLFLINVNGGSFALEGADLSDAPPAVRDLARVTAAPNPFNPRTRIELAVPADGPCRVTVHDLQGRAVRTIHDGHLLAGRHAWSWDGLAAGGQPAASGVYLVRAQTPAGPAQTKVVLAK